MSTNSNVYAIELTNNKTFLWRGRKRTYEGLTSVLGIQEIASGRPYPENGSFESDQLPPEIYIRTEEGNSYVRRINPNNIAEQVYKFKLIGKKIKNAQNRDETICSVSMKNN